MERIRGRRLKAVLQVELASSWMQGMSRKCSDAGLVRHCGTTLHRVDKNRPADPLALMPSVDREACQQQNGDVAASLAPQQARGCIVGMDGAGCDRVVAHHTSGAIGRHIDSSGAVVLGLTRIAMEPGIERVLATPEPVERMPAAKRLGMRVGHSGVLGGRPLTAAPYSKTLGLA